MKKISIFILIFFTCVSLLAAAYNNSSYESLLQTLAKIYRYGRITSLLNLCTPRGKRFYNKKIKRIGRQRFINSLKRIGRKITAVTLNEIIILQDGRLKIKFSFHLRYGRKIYKKHGSFLLKKINKRFYIDGE